MACATLKRSLDWENLNQRPSKRRRCNPFDDTTTRIPTSIPFKSTNTAAAAAAAALMVRDTNSKRLAVRERCNPFLEANVPDMTTAKVSQNICDEIKRLHKRKQLPFTVSALENMNETELSGSEMLPESSLNKVTASAASPSTSTVTASRNSEKPLFTFKQVRMICERMLKEREEELCEEYNAILTTKLAEQYDMFVKFTYDQIQKRYESAPSYLS